MPGDILTGKWNQMKGDMKKWWGALSDDDLTYINGDRQKLYGKLQERYGWDKMRAQTEVDKRLKEYDPTYTPM
jgi:uncharacterized protein YjbJ (UPF0337 family)